MNTSPIQGLFYKKPQEASIQLQKAMESHISRQTPMPNKIQKPLYKPIPPGMKIPPGIKIPEQYLHKHINPNLPSKISQGISSSDISFGEVSHISYLKSENDIKKTHMEKPSMSKNIPSNNMNQIKPVIQHSSMNSQSSSQNMPIHRRPIPTFHPSYFLLSQFPLLYSKDQIYLPVINRLENKQTKFFINQLYVNFKFLLIQSDEQFGKYLEYLSNMALHGHNQKDIQKGYELRIALEACLQNFNVKEFNKFLSLDEIKSCSVAFSKKIYDYEAIFQSQAFRKYQKLVDTVLQFYERILNAKTPQLKNIVVSSWYIDTIKVLHIAIIYGHKQPKRVKSIIEKMFSLNPTIYKNDFTNFLINLQSYMQKSCSYFDEHQSLSLLETLSKKITAMPNKGKYKSNFHNPEKFFTRQIFVLCSECLKIFMFVTNIFKFFPSIVKLIFMKNINLLQILIKISIRVIYNLRGEEKSTSKKRWKFSTKVKSLIKQLEFIMMDKACQMYKLIFYNAKMAVQQQISERQKSQAEFQQEKIILKFYRKLIDNMVNRRKDAEKDKQLQLKDDKSKSQKSQETGEQTQQPNTQVQQDISKSEQNKQKDDEQQNSEQEIVKDCFQNYKSQQNKNEKQKSPKKVIELQYGRTILKFLLLKQLKKDQNKYLKAPFLYTQKLQKHFTDVQASRLSGSELNSNSQKMYLRIALLRQFETQVKQQYLLNKEMNNKFFKIDLKLRQLPTLEEFVRSQEIRERDLLRKKLNASNKDYEDQPTYQQEMEFAFNQRMMDEEDFTRLQLSDFNINRSNDISFSANKQQSQNLAEETDMQNSSEVWVVQKSNLMKRRPSDRNNRFMQDDQSDEELSPEQISDLELSQLIGNQGLNVSTSQNTSLMTSMNSSIFKPHQTMKKVRQSMTREELDYFNKIKDLSWHQISRISIKQQKGKPEGSSSHDISLLMAQNSMLKVGDIGYSFDMVLNEDSQSFVQGMTSNRSRFSHFYYDQYRDTQNGHKKKSFMDSYDFSHVDQEQQAYQPQQDQMEQKQQNNEQRKNYIKYNGNKKMNVVNEKQSVNNSMDASTMSILRKMNQGQKAKKWTLKK